LPTDGGAPAGAAVGAVIRAASGCSPNVLDLGLQLLQLLPHDRHLLAHLLQIGAGIVVDFAGHLDRAHVDCDIITDTGEGVLDLLDFRHHVDAQVQHRGRETGLPGFDAG
jgi:hypothetical protein